MTKYIVEVATDAGWYDVAGDLEELIITAILEDPRTDVGAVEVHVSAPVDYAKKIIEKYERDNPRNEDTEYEETTESKPQERHIGLTVGPITVYAPTAEELIEKAKEWLDEFIPGKAVRIDFNDIHRQTDAWGNTVFRADFGTHIAYAEKIEPEE